LDLDKLAIQDRVKNAYRIDPDDPNKTVKKTLVGNPETDPVPIENVDSKEPKIYIHPIGSGDENTEKSQLLTNGTRRIIIKVRKKVDTTLRVAFVENGTNNLTDEFMQIEPGGFLDLDGLNFIDKTVYFQSDKSDRTIEILELS